MYHINKRKGSARRRLWTRLLAVLLCVLTVLPVFAAALRSAPQSTGRCEFANTISTGTSTFAVYHTGVTAIMKADAFGPSGGIVSFELPRSSE